MSDEQEPHEQERLAESERFYARYSGATQRARLLDAAARVVAENGYHGATVSAIVSSAGVSRSSFYEHFDGKQGCVLEAYAEATDIVVQHVAEAASAALSSGLEAALDAGIGRYFALVRQQPTLARLAFVELPSMGGEGRAATAAAQTRHVDSILALAPVFHLDARTLRPAVQLVIAGIDALVGQALLARDDELLDAAESAARRTMRAVLLDAG